MKVLKILTVMLLFALATSFVKPKTVEEAPIPEDMILMYANGDMAVIVDGDPCWKYYYEDSATGDFDLFWVWCP